MRRGYVESLIPFLIKHKGHEEHKGGLSDDCDVLGWILVEVDSVESFLQQYHKRKSKGAATLSHPIKRCVPSVTSTGSVQAFVFKIFLVIQTYSSSLRCL